MKPIWVFFHCHSQIKGLQGKEEGISLTPHYHLFHGHLDISWAITVESSALHIGSSQEGYLMLMVDYKGGKGSKIWEKKDNAGHARLPLPLQLEGGD